MNDSPSLFCVGQLVLERWGKQFIPAFLFTGRRADCGNGVGAVTKNRVWVIVLGNPKT